jgi:hypothetical protein
MCNLRLYAMLTSKVPFEHIYARVDEKTSRQGAKTQRLVQEQIRPFAPDFRSKVQSSGDTNNVVERSET